MSGSLDKTVKLWHLVDGTTAGEPCTVLRGHTAAVRAVGQLINGRLWSASDDGTVRIWSSTDGKQFAVLPIGASVLSVLEVVPTDGGDALLLTGGVDGTLLFWRVHAAGGNLSPMKTIPGAHTGGITCMCVLPPAVGAPQRVATGGMDGACLLWDVHAGAVVARYEGHNGAITGLAVVSPTMFASVSMDKTIRTWGPGNTSEGVSRGHTHWINAVLLLPSTGQLLTAGSDRTLRWWQRPDYGDSGAWTCVRVFPAERRVSTMKMDDELDASTVIYSPLARVDAAPAFSEKFQEDQAAVKRLAEEPAASPRPPIVAAAGVTAAVVVAAIALMMAAKGRGQGTKPDAEPVASSSRLRRAQRRAAARAG